MNILYISISLCHLQFLSSMSYSFLSFTSLDRFIPRCFIIFDVMVNGIVSLISFSDLLLLVYKNPRDFSVLILCPATLLNSLVSSRSFLIALLEFAGVGDGQGGLACCSSWGRKESAMTERLNCTELCVCIHI